MNKFLMLLKSDKRVLFSTLLAIVFVVSFVFFIFSCSNSRYVLYFPMFDSEKNIVEIRRVKKDKVRTNIQIFVDELILGPTIQRAMPIFPLGTKVKSCFERNKVLYLDISEEAFHNFSDYSTINEKMIILKKNIMKNFKNIKNIELYIEGNQVCVANKI